MKGYGKGKHLTEAECLKLIRKKLGVEKPTRLNLAGTTDDAALVDVSALPRFLKGKLHSARAIKNILLVASQDGMVEDVHFRLSYMTPAEALTRCLVANLSDISAMGAVPIGVLVNIGLPKRMATELVVQSLANALNRLSRTYGLELLGGDLISADKLMTSISILGAVERDCAIRRNGAMIGEKLYLSGPLGLSSLGLKLLEESSKGKLSGTKLESFAKAVEAFKKPKAKIEFGRALARHKVAGSAIDLSDSLSKSVLLLAEESQVGFEVYLPRRTLHPLVRRYYSPLSEKDFLRIALSAEEDFELLFTAKPENLARLPTKLARGVIEIGRVVPKRQDVHLISQNKKLAVRELGYQHF